MTRHFRQAGFTIIEVLVIAPIMVVSISVIITFIVNIFLDINTKSANVELQSSAQAALFTVRDDVMNTVYFLGTNQGDSGAIGSGVEDPNKASGWNALADNALIIQEVAYTAPRQNTARKVVYVNNTPADCTGADFDDKEQLNQMSTNMIVYFVSNSKLYARTLVPDQSGNCGTTYRKTTCPTATASCPRDQILAENVKSFSIKYYTSYWDTETEVVPTENRQFVQITRADLSLTLEKMINGEPTTANANIALRRIN